MMDALYKGLGTLLHFIYYNFGQDYGIAIIVFTVLLKLLLLPIAIKQQKAMVDMQKVQPKIEELRKKYKNDMQKLNEETMKLYAEHKVNPLGGCLPTLIQLPIFIALYRVITQPLKYILNFTDNQLLGINYAINPLIKPEVINNNNGQIQMIEYSKKIIHGLGSTDIVHALASKIQSLPELPYLLANLKKVGIINMDQAADLIHRASELSMNFLGLNLAQYPKNSLGILLIIPILAGLTTYISSKMMTSITPSTGDNTTQNTMMAMMPVMTVFFTLSMPAGLGVYWIVNNLIQMVQQYFLNKLIPREGASGK